MKENPMKKQPSKGFISTADGADIPYFMFGSGSTPVVVIPGAGDGLTTVYEGAAKLGLYYRRRARDFRLLLLSRRQPFPEGFTMEQQAEDMLYAIEKLGWPASVLELNSAGGPVGQWMAVKRPDWVKGLILSCTLHRTNEYTRGVLQMWKTMCAQRRWKDLNWSSIEHTFRPSTVAKYRLFRPILGLMKPPSDPTRLPRIFEALLDVDNRPILPRITCPALVIGGADDRVIPAEIQREMADLIPGSQIILYPGYGHGNDQENPEYEVQVRRFISKVFQASPK
jgi:pimeloyl-ACP methyl ester carboxylesterase